MTSEPIAGRPGMAAGYGIATGAEGLLPWNWVTERMVAARNYWVGTTRPDGRPHVAPVWGLWLDDAFFFGTDPASRKGKNIQEQPYVVVHLESGDDVVILEGTVEVEEDEDVLARMADAYEAKYSYRPPGAYRVEPTVAFAWREQDFPTSATRWVFEG